MRARQRNRCHYGTLHPYACSSGPVDMCTRTLFAHTTRCNMCSSKLTKSTKCLRCVNSSVCTHRPYPYPQYHYVIKTVRYDMNAILFVFFDYTSNMTIMHLLKVFIAVVYHVTCWIDIKIPRSVAYTYICLF